MLRKNPWRRVVARPPAPFELALLFPGVLGGLRGLIGLFRGRLEQRLGGAEPLADGRVVLLCGLPSGGFRPAGVGIAVGVAVRRVVRDLGRRLPLKRQRRIAY